MTKLTDRTPAQDVLQHCIALGLDVKSISSCLGVHPKTIQRWQDGTCEPSEAGQRLLDKLENIHSTASRLLKKTAIKSWFSTPNETLGRRRPLDLIERGELDAVQNVLGMLEWGIHS